MTRIVTIVAEYGGEQREVFHINQGNDRSLYLNFGSRLPDSHISLHKSGDFHVTRCKDGKRMCVTLPEGQPLSTYKGCSSPNECIIDKALLSTNKKSNTSALKGDIFTVDLNRLKAPLVAVAIYLFDHSSVQIFDNEVSKYTKPITKVVNTIIPHIGLIAHEPQVTQPSSP
jgi:hypothetical protein